MQRLKEKRLRQKEAAAMLGVGVRQIKRLLRNYRRSGAQGLVSKRRGQASTNQLDEKVKRKVLDLLGGKYRGFGPTLACEKLVEVEKISISDESVRQLMMAEGWWKARKTAKPVMHQMRERRACFGELVLMDDATGKLLGLQFADQESFHNYARLVHTYLERCGKPLAFYSDKHGVFRVNQASREKGDAQTQFGRAMQELEIELLCANSPQAKDYDSYCTSFVVSSMFLEAGNRRRFANFCPRIFAGESEPGGSNRQTPLSLEKYPRSRPALCHFLTVFSLMARTLAISSTVSIPASRRRS